MDVRTQIDHLRQAYGCRLQEHLAEVFGVKRRAVSEWKRAGRLPWRVVAKASEDARLNKVRLPDAFFDEYRDAS